MTPSELINLSMEQVVETFGDPTEAVFTKMYERFPALGHFRGTDTSWQNYMMQEILGNLMQYADDPDSALVTIRDMTDHHRLIGLPLDVFKGMYSTMLDVLNPAFQGEHRDEMIDAWSTAINAIHDMVDHQSSAGI